LLQVTLPRFQNGDWTKKIERNLRFLTRAFPGAIDLVTADFSLTGEGPDPNKPKAKKAKQIRLERKREKMLKKGNVVQKCSVKLLVSCLHVRSTMGVSKESISKFFNRKITHLHLSPYI